MRLPPEVVDLIRRAGAQKDRDERRSILKDACAAVEYPQGRIYPLPSELTPLHRAFAERVAAVDARPSPYAMPAHPAIRRRWLGLAPGGALDEPFGVEPLWRLLQRMQVGAANAYDGAKVTAELLNTMPIARRLRVFADLYAVPVPSAVYDIDGSMLFFHGGLRLVDDIDEAHGKWAAAEADRLVELGRHPPEEIRLVVFTALARAKVKIAPRWDVLLPVALVWKDNVAECMRAIPEKRRGPAAAAALRITPTEHAMNAVLDLRERFPSREIESAYLDLCERAGRPLEVEVVVKAKVPKKKAASKKKAAPKKKAAIKKRVAKRKTRARR